MASTSSIASTLRRALLVKVISKPTPSRDDVTAVIELTSAKVVEALQSQSMTLYLVEGNQIVFRHVYYSPSLWAANPSKAEGFKANAAKLLELKLPLGQGIVGKVIAEGKPIFFQNTQTQAPMMLSMAQTTGFEVCSMLTVPLRVGSLTIGAIQVLNKEPIVGTQGIFSTGDVVLLQEVAEYSAALIQRMLDPKFQPNPDDTAKFIARLTDHPLVTKIEELTIDENLVTAIGDAIIRREQIFPCSRTSPNSISVLMTNPLDYARREAFQQATELVIDEISIASAPFIEALVKKHFKNDPAATTTDVDISSVAEVISSAYSGDGTGEIKVEDLENEDSAPVIQLTNRIIEDAYICGASDIHIEPMEKDLVIRYRIDGLCQEKLRLPKQVANGLVTRLKIMCNLDIAERRLPQDGRIVFKKYTKKNIDIDLRVATGPMNHGEKVVMRILDKTKSTLPLPALGFSDENLARYRECIRMPYGMILHCGPTGSGKSMTLYSALGEVNTPDVNIQTAEDPIEYTLPGLNQMQMNRQIGLTFARALRCYLRMDPDIILVGEIRDEETAQIAVEAALTGHLLVSTLHTNDAPSTISRIGEMGVEPFNISASLVCVCAQRLLRRVCKNCKMPYEPEGREKKILEEAIGWSGPIFKANAQGCPTCNGAGYKGRVGIHELMINNEELTNAINKEVEVAELKRIAMRTGMKTLHQDSMLKVKMGLTTIEEALSNVPPDLIK
ncbi:MAG: Flp pilus assembly complex ATPase component TadA [Opitutus sp.]|nr:Flp pilus assembly complex ATPase component TadA [Opitutus sp.]MCS6246466.1 Flp pilus assembly complex ATPase component TadA [Opitutus sp.]MCS6273359.1 Flp pilus assembly complex ATPase component TadA [Opitutus sp.]MCS6278761.1 Flp pilus assembly complex ATPase component TadA [Opitutus sp.]MCS6299661.1 Flp pilus assembly complex ATPase component TadA [Opitutus sp.]